MPKIPPLSAKVVVRLLQKLGFYKHHQVGSHIQLRHKDKTHLRVTISRNDQFDLPPSVVSSILKRADVTRDEFLKLIRKNRR